MAVASVTSATHASPPNGLMRAHSHRGSAERTTMLESGGEANQEQTVDDAERVENPAVGTDAEVADGLMDLRVPWAKQAVHGVGEDEPNRRDDAGPPGLGLAMLGVQSNVNGQGVVA